MVVIKIQNFNNVNDKLAGREVRRIPGRACIPLILESLADGAVAAKGIGAGWRGRGGPGLSQRTKDTDYEQADISAEQYQA